MKKKQITVLTCLMLGLGGLGLHAQSGSYGPISGSSTSSSFDHDINQNNGVIIRANNDNNNSNESIRFVIGRLDNNNANSYTAEFTRNGMNLLGNRTRPFADLQSDKGIRIEANADQSGDGRIRFAVGGGNSREGNLLVADMTYDDGLIVYRKARFNEGIDGDLGFGTMNAQEKIHVNGGNIRVDGGQYQSHGPIVLHPDVDDNGDDIVEFRNSRNEEMAKIQDGELFLRRSGSDGGLISSNGMLRFQPDNNNTGDDRIVFLNQSGNEMTRIQDGVITTDQVRLNVTTFPDYVFAKDYKLMPLKEVAQYIKANKHLPNMPTEAEVVAEGMNVGQINTVLVEKVEELTLHTINQEEKIEQLMKKIEALEAAMNK